VLILARADGQELIAGALHTLSQRGTGNYVRINCRRFPKRCSKGELFGHEKGAFTGALKQKPGRVEEAGWRDHFPRRNRAT